MSLTKVGINLAGGSGYDCVSLPFADLMYMASGMFGGGSTPFGRDSRGWPTSVPDPANLPTAILALNAIMPAGNYPVTATGRGTLRFNATGVNGWQTVTFDGSGAPQAIRTTGGGGDGAEWQIQVVATDPADHLTEVNVRLPNATSSVFNPDFKALIAPFSCYRFMDWTGTNGSPLINWSDRLRPGVGYYCLGDRGSVDYETCIALANEMGKDAWVNIPHGASDDAVDRLAQLWDSTLDPARTMYVEYSNEFWNYGFRQWNYFIAQSTDPTDPPHIQVNGNVYGAAVLRMGYCLNRFKAAVSPSRRLVRVAGGQAGNFGGVSKGVDEGLVGNGYPYDAMAIAPYISTNADLEAAGALYHTDPAAALDAVFAGVATYVTDLIGQVALHVNYFRPLGKDVLIYEGGQGFGGSDAALPVMVAANLDPRMGAAYRTLTDAINGMGGVSLKNYFNDTGTWNHFGLWGHRRNTYAAVPGVRWDTIVAEALAASGGPPPPPPPPPNFPSRPKRFVPLRRISR